MARTNQQNLFVAVLAIGLLVAVAYGGGLFSVLGPGTGLTSGQTLEVVQEFRGEQDEFLTGVISTDGNDAVTYTLDESVLPSSFGSDQTATITFLPVESEQRASIQDVVRVHELTAIIDNHKPDFSTRPDGVGLREFCEMRSTFDTYKDELYPQAVVSDLYVVRQRLVDVGPWYSSDYRCRFTWVAQQEGGARIGTLQHSSLSTEQVVRLNEADEWVLTNENNFSTQTTNGYVQNLAGNNIHEPIRTSNVWAVDDQPLRANTWTAANIRTDAQSLISTREDLNASADPRNLVQRHNNLLASILNSTQTTPPSWEGETKSVQNLGDELVIQRLVTQGSDYEVALNADILSVVASGLNCEIIQSPTTAAWSEEEQATVAYTIKNTGNSAGEVVVRSSCSGGTIASSEDRLSIDSRAQHSGELLLSAQTSGEPLNADCSLVCQPVVSQDNFGDVQAFSAAVEPLTDCEQGQQSEPLLIDGELVIYEYTSTCAVASTTTCSVEEGARLTAGGDYVCGSGVDFSAAKQFFAQLGIALSVGLGIIFVLLLGVVALGVALVRRD